MAARDLNKLALKLAREGFRTIKQGGQGGLLDYLARL